MAHVMSLIFYSMSIDSMLHVDLKKSQCRPVEFKGQGPKGGGPGEVYYQTEDGDCRDHIA